MHKYEQQVEKQDIETYKQDLGLRKMLYKYENENEQLKNQIRALTQKLTTILSKSPEKTEESKQQNVAQQITEKFLRDQMNALFKQIQNTNNEIKKSKDVINTQKENEFIFKQNRLKDKEHQVAKLREKLQKYKEDEDHQKNSLNTKRKVMKQEQFQKQADKLADQLEALKRRVRELEKTRDQNHRKELNTHLKIVNLETKNRRIKEVPKGSSQDKIQDKGPKKKGLWHLQLSQQNYYKIKEQLEQLRKERQVMVDSIKIENKNLSDRIYHLKIENETVNNSSYSLEMPQIKKTLKRKPEQQLSHRASKTPTILNKSLNLGPSQYERKNDKNYVMKNERIIEWVSPVSKKGLAWKDDSFKSPITGINLWFDKWLIGIQFIHMVGESVQHLHLVGKKLSPIQYRLTGSDYLQNITLAVKEGMISGMEMLSKNGRKDHFGEKIGQNGTKKFDFGIKSPQKPIYSYGTFIIGKQNTSIINKLGFAVI